ADVAQRLPGLPAAGPAVVVAIDEPAGGGDEQAEGHVGGGVGEHAGGVADADAALGGRRDVDVVEADGVVADGLEAGGGVEQGGVDPVGQQRHQAVAAGGFVAEGLVGRGQLPGPNLGVGLGEDLVEAGGGDAAGDEDLRTGGHRRRPSGRRRAYCLA